MTSFSFVVFIMSFEEYFKILHASEFDHLLINPRKKVSGQINKFLIYIKQFFKHLGAGMNHF